VSEDETKQTAVLLSRMSAGDAGAADELMSIVYDELHRIADRLMSSQPDGHTLQPTALIHEAFVKLAGGERKDDWKGRVHFLRVAARAMRSVLVDHVRAQATHKRSGKRRGITLHEDRVSIGDDAAKVLAVHEGLAALSAIHEQEASIVELRFFGGFTYKEIAEIVDTPLRSVERSWQFARAWLRRHFEENGSGGGIE
jgi:RNA polymerase sigma factor (TIGR02999 family)